MPTRKNRYTSSPNKEVGRGPGTPQKPATYDGRANLGTTFRESGTNRDATARIISGPNK